MQRPFPLSVLLIAFFGLLAANASIYKAVYSHPAPSITVFEVGKSRAFLMWDASRQTLLIDTGSDASILRTLGATLPVWDRHIDALVFTSEKTASLGGFAAVADRYSIGTTVGFGAKNSKTAAPVPYGATLLFGTDTFITVLAPQSFTVSYGNTSLTFSSSTPSGTYRLEKK